MDYKIYPFKRGNKYQLCVQFRDKHGVLKRRQTGVSFPLKASLKQRLKAYRKAEKIAPDIYIEIMTGSTANRGPRVLFLSQYLQEYYYPHIESCRAKSTMVSYSNALTHFMRICGDRILETYTRQHFQKYKLQRYNEEEIKKTTINIELRSIKAAFSWAYKNDILDRNPFKGQDYLFDTKPNRRAFKDYEIQKLLQVTEGKMIGLVIRLAYYTGMRVGELSELTWEMVNIKGRYIHLPAEITKTNTARSIPLGEKAFNIIKILENLLQTKMRKNPEWYENVEKAECHVLQKQRGYGRYEPRSIQDMFRKSMTRVGLTKELKFHCLRHSFATHLLEKGADIYAVSKIMGHSTPAVTSQFYDHTTALSYRHVADMI